MYKTEILASRLKKARKFRNLSKEEMGALFDIHPNSYLRWESGAATLNARQLAVLAEYEKIDLNYFFDPDLTLQEGVRENRSLLPLENPRIIDFAEHLAELDETARERVLDRCEGFLEAVKEELEEVREWVEIPFYGQIAGGAPLMVEDYLGETVKVPRKVLIGKDHYFAVRVRGDSMTGAGIMDRDVVILRAQSNVENGQIAAVSYDGEATLKRVYKRADKVELHPCNKIHRVIVADAEDVRIQGLFVKVLDNQPV